MSLYDDAIGGYFELEQARAASSSPMSVRAVELNSARNCLEYILEVTRPSKVYIPKYTCDVLLEPFSKTGVKYEFYHVDANLELGELPVLASDELLLYTNYFGIKNSYSGALAQRYGRQLVIDASQAFYYAPEGDEKVFYSPRKFFGVPDGGFLITDEKLSRVLEVDVSNQRMSHLLKRLELSAEEGYEDFKHNDKSLENQPILSMSILTKRLLSGIDYDSVEKKRKDNFRQLHAALEDTNELATTVEEDAVPMVYPYLTKDAEALRKALIDHRIFVATYWPNVFSWCSEGELEVYLAKSILPLPIDQRYRADDMKKIIEVINEGKY